MTITSYEKRDGYVLVTTRTDGSFFVKKEKISYEDYERIQEEGRRREREKRKREEREVSEERQRQLEEKRQRELEEQKQRELEEKRQNELKQKQKEEQQEKNLQVALRNNQENTQFICNAKLSVASSVPLTSEECNELETRIDAMVNAHKSNRYEINRLVFESVNAMTMGEDFERELERKSGFRRFLGGITGSNKKLQDKINSNHAAAQYAAQQILQRLAEQNLMSFDLITVVNNKLNASIVAIEGEINQIYSALITFFKQSHSDIIQLENRVDQLERNVNLLNWVNSIEYQMFNGVEYADLDDISKIVCLARDFYDITKGEWTTSDLLLLKTAMATIDISPKEKVEFFKIIKDLYYRPELRKHLLLNYKVEMEDIDSNLIALAGLQKLQLLEFEEKYIIDTISNMFYNNGIDAHRRSIQEDLAKKYLENENRIDLSTKIDFYDLIIEILFDLWNYDNIVKEHHNEKFGIDEKIDKIENSNSNIEIDEFYEELEAATKELFNYSLSTAFNLLNDLSKKNCGRAKFLLGEIFYKHGYNNTQKNDVIANKLFFEGMQIGDILSTINYAYTLQESEKEKILSDNIPLVKQLVEQGDIIAKYEYADLILSQRVSNADFLDGIALLEDSAKNGYWIAAKRLGSIYWNGKYNCPIDYNKSCLWYSFAAELGDIVSMRWIAKSYEGNRMTSNRDLTNMAKWYIKAANAGDLESYRDAGVALYIDGSKEKGIWYLREAVRLGYKPAIQDIKDIYGSAFYESDLQHGNETENELPTVYC